MRLKIMRNNLEHNHQVALFYWAAIPLTLNKYPELAYMYAVPNAARRSPRQGKWMKDEGMRAGVPDIFLPVARGEYHGMYIEMKAGKGRLSPLQQAYIQFLLGQGYHCVVMYDWQSAKDEIIKYMEL